MYQTILVPLDGSSCGERALPVAAALAHASGAKVVLVRAAVEPESKAVREAEAYLAEIAGRLTKQGLEVASVVPNLPACDGILSESQRHLADLIVMCSHGRSGVGRWLYGSTAEGVLMHSHIPVMLVRPTDAPLQFAPKGSSLLVPLDGSTFAEAVLPYASTLAQALDASLVLLRVVPLADYAEPMPDDTYVFQQKLVDQEQAEAERYLAGVAAQLVQKTGLRVVTRAGLGWPAEMIVDEARSSGASLVAMATHGHTGLREMIMGRVALEVLRQSSRPLLLLRPDESNAG